VPRFMVQACAGVAGARGLHATAEVSSSMACLFQLVRDINRAKVWQDVHIPNAIIKLLKILSSINSSAQVVQRPRIGSAYPRYQ
jgi:hypothetical protein